MAEGMGYSLSDIISATRGNDGLFGGNGGMFALLFLILIMGNGAWGGNNYGRAEAIQTQMQQGFDNQNNMANQREILNSTNQVYHDLASFVGDKYSELDRDILSVSSSIQNVIANQNQCCCSIQRAIDGVNYANAQNTVSINANTTAGIQKILDTLAQNKIDALENKVASLELQNSLANVVRYPNGYTYNAGQSPFCNGCGCGF